MALSKTVLRGLIQTKLAALSPPVTLGARDLDVYEAIADAIVTHITTSGVVAVTSVSGVTVGAGVSGPGAGTIS